MRRWLLGTGVRSSSHRRSLPLPVVRSMGPRARSPTVAGVEGCSGTDATLGDSSCMWTATDPNGWVGVGPFTITYDPPDPPAPAPPTPPVVVTCAAGEQCTAPDPDPIPAGSVVVTNGGGPGGGTFAAGDPDQHNGA